MFHLLRHFKEIPVNRIFSLLIIVIFFFAALSVRPAEGAASTRYAAPSAVGSGNCSSWANACTLQTALTGASSGDVIWVKAGTHYPTSGTDRTISFVLKNGVSVYGGFAGTETLLSQRDPSANSTILSGDIGTVNDASDNSYHVVVGSGTNSTAVLDGVTITAGNGNGTGDQGLGGGLYNDDGSPTVSNVTVSNNTAGQGGGMYNNHTSTGSSPTLTNVTFDSNSAGYGGGLYNLSNSNASLTNVTFYNNHASPRGGAIYNNNSTPILTNVTFGANTAPGGGSAIYLDYGNPIIQDSIFWGSVPTVGNESAIISDTIVQGGCAIGITCTNVLNVNPLLGALQDNGGDTPTMALGAGSPAIDAGNDATCAATDQRGISRPQGSHCDMGAYEVQEQSGPDLIVNTTADTDDGYCTEVDCSLREAINAANIYSSTATITFDNSVFSTTQTILLTSTLPSITSTVVISGPGSDLLTVDGNNAYRVFDAEAGSDLTLDGLTIAHGYHSGPGAGLFVGQGNATILNSTFFSNTATTRGGGIYFNGGGTLAVSNTSLISNTADVDGGAIGVRNGTATLTNSTLSNNSATYGGGIYNWDTLTVISSTLSNNSTTSNGGGGIYHQGHILAVTDSVFSGNTSVFGGGIAIITETLTVSNSLFSGNTATGVTGGGGIYAQGSGTRLAVFNSTFDSNTADDGSGHGAGGGLDVGSSVITATVDDSTFFGNSAGATGGGISTIRPLTVTNSTILGNSAPTGGGIDSRSGATTMVISSTISGNSATNDGGGVAIAGGYAVITGSEIFSNTTIGTSNGNLGGGLFVGNAVVTATHTQIHHNWAGAGGAIGVAAGQLILDSSTVYQNKGEYHPGFYLEGGASATIRNSTISGNGDAFNGAIRSNTAGNEIRITQSTIADNQGGGLEMIYGSLFLTNTIIANNGGAGDCFLEYANGATLTSGDHNLAGDGTCDLAAAHDITGTNPLLGMLADNDGSILTMALLPGSPAIDAGGDSVCADAATGNDLDQRGVARPQGSHCDIGAFESRGFTLVKSSGDNQATVINTAFAAPLVVTVTSAFAEPTNGGSVAFVGPMTGAGLASITTTAIIAGDIATANVTANGSGGPYPVSVNTNGASASLTFNLTNTYLITPTAGAHGSITPSTPQMVNAGESITFTIVADIGYHIVDVGADGMSLGPIGSYTFANVTANHTITAAFASNTYTLTVATGGIGSGVVTPTIGVHTYAYGTVVTITQAADPASFFSGWSGDCSGSGSCAVTMTTDRSVVANFDQHRIYLPLVARNF